MKKKLYFVCKIFRFLCCSGIHKLQNLWRHHRRYCILENTFCLFLLNALEYQDETWWNIGIAYEHFYLIFSSVLRPETSSRPFCDFQKISISCGHFIFSSCFRILMATEHTFKRIENLKLIIIGYWVMITGWKLKKSLV